MTKEKWALLLGSFIGAACAGENVGTGDEGPTLCVGGEFCPDNQICVDGFCVDPSGTETSSSGDACPVSTVTRMPMAMLVMRLPISENVCVSINR